MSITCLIIDDERLARSSLRAVLKGFPEIEVVGEAATVCEALEAVQRHRPSLIFLDIQMPGGSGFDLLAQIEHPPSVIFVTAYDRYAIRAFEVNAIDYLLKPIEPERLRSSLDRIIAGTVNPPCGIDSTATALLNMDDSVVLNSGIRCVMTLVSDVLIVRSDGNYTCVYLADKSEHMVRVTLKNWTARLPNSAFVQLSRSLIINRIRVCGWEPKGRGLVLHFRDSILTVHLSRVEADRFKSLIAL